MPRVDPGPNKTVAVLGAGIVGVCITLHLVRLGMRVVLDSVDDHRALAAGTPAAR